MRTGYGHSLLAAEHPSILVSFAEYLKVSEVERLTLAVPPMNLYQPITEKVAPPANVGDLKHVRDLRFIGHS